MFSDSQHYIGSRARLAIIYGMYGPYRRPEHLSSVILRGRRGWNWCESWQLTVIDAVDNEFFTLVLRQRTLVSVSSV